MDTTFATYKSLALAGMKAYLAMYAARDARALATTDVERAELATAEGDAATRFQICASARRDRSLSYGAVH